MCAKTTGTQKRLTLGVVFYWLNCCVYLMTLTVFVLWFSLCCHIFQFRVQFSLQMCLLTGVQRFVFLSTPSIKNNFFAYSLPSVGLGLISTAMNLRNVYK